MNEVTIRAKIDLDDIGTSYDDTLTDMLKDAIRKAVVAKVIKSKKYNDFIDKITAETIMKLTAED